jgi:hypothetical protein
MIAVVLVCASSFRGWDRDDWETRSEKPATAVRSAYGCDVGRTGGWFPILASFEWTGRWRWRVGGAGFLCGFDSVPVADRSRALMREMKAHGLTAGRIDSCAVAKSFISGGWKDYRRRSRWTVDDVIEHISSERNGRCSLLSRYG